MTSMTAHPSLALKLMILGRRRPGSTLAEHRRHIRQVHGKMVLDYIALDAAAAPQRYVQNVVLDGSYRPTAPAVDPLALQRDFVTQIWFADFAALARSRETAFYRDRLHGDEDNFVDQASVVFVPTREHAQWQREAASGASIKLFCGLQRSHGVAPEAFLRAWLDAAAGLPSLNAVHAVQRHVCNEVLGKPGQPSSLDGIDEFWLDDEKAAHALLAQWRSWVDQKLVLTGLVAADAPFFLITREDVLHAGLG